MGLLSILLDGTLISAGFAATRRLTSINVHQRVLSNINSDMAKKAANGFFNVGEWVVDKSINIYKDKIVNRAGSASEDVPEAKYKEIEKTPKKKDD